MFPYGLLVRRILRWGANRIIWKNQMWYTQIRKYEGNRLPLNVNSGDWAAKSDWVDATGKR
jgi:hypothetical protein